MFTEADFPSLSSACAQKPSQKAQQQSQQKAPVAPSVQDEYLAQPPPQQRIKLTIVRPTRQQQKQEQQSSITIVKPQIVQSTQKTPVATAATLAPDTYIKNGLHYSAKTNLPLWPQPAPKLSSVPMKAEDNVRKEGKEAAAAAKGGKEATEDAEEKKKKRRRKRTRKRNRDPVKVLDDGVYALNLGKLVTNQIRDERRKMKIREMQSLMNSSTDKKSAKNKNKKKKDGKKKKSVQLVSAPASCIEDDESIGSAKSLVLIGKNKDTAAKANKELSVLVSNHKRGKTKKLTKLKKSIYRYRLKSFIEGERAALSLEAPQQKGPKKNKKKSPLTESSAALILSKIDKKTSRLFAQPSAQEVKTAAATTNSPEMTKESEEGGGAGEVGGISNDTLVCKWAMCGETFKSTKEGLAKFKAHLEEHARADQEDMMCLWEGCEHPMFVKLRTLRLHAQRHAKLNRPKPLPVWTKELVSDLKKAPRREPVDILTVFPQLPASPEIDACVAALLPPLGLFQSKVKAKKALTPAETAAAARKQRYVVGMREATREVRGGSAKLVVLAHKVENIDTPGGPLAQIRKIVQYAQEKGIPLVVSHSRKKLSALLRSQVKKEEEEEEEKKKEKGMGKDARKRKDFNFGVSVVAVTSAEGADQPFKKIIELLKRNCERLN